METMLIHIVKSAGLLSIFYICYLLLLRNDTSFDLNRKFLLGGILTSAILPTLYFTRKVLIEAPAQFVSIPVTGFSETATILAQPLLTPWEIAGIAYIAVTAVLLLRYLYQLFRIFYVIRTHENKVVGRFSLIETQHDHGPFSFFNYIVYNPAMHNSQELELIIKHEKVHSSQFHTLDILIGNLTSCILWFNPLCWLYKKSIVQNLEYIADKETVAASASKKEYLKTLVKVSIGNLHPALTNSFYQSFIKKRIVMLNKKSNPKKNNFWKVSLVLPAILAFMLTFNVQTEFYAQEKSTTEATSNVEIFIDIDKNTTQKELDGYKALLNEHNVIINFEEVKYNNENLLTNIKAEFIDRSNVSSGTITKSNPEGIAPFRYIYSKVEGSRFTTSKVHSPEREIVQLKRLKALKNDTTSGSEESFTYVTSKIKPLYIVNGDSITTRGSGNKLNFMEVSGSQVFYARGPKDGAVSINSKNGSDTSAYTYSFSADSLIHINASQNVKQKIYALKTGGDANYKVGQREFYISSLDSTNKPLYIVDGKEMDSDFELNSLNDSQMENIYVIKGSSATEKYGDKAKGGAIEITTKSSPVNETQKAIVVELFAATTEEGLRIIKEQLLKQAGLEVQFENIKRNKEGLITNIKITSKHKKSKVSAIFSETGGIPKIYVGQINGELVVSSTLPEKN